LCGVSTLTLTAGLIPVNHDAQPNVPPEHFVPRLLNALVYAHIRYEDMIGITDVEFMPFRDEERTAYPQWFKGECVYSIDDAITFMALICCLPMTQAIAWVCRAKIQQVRSGLIEDARSIDSQNYGN
jgi:hypothetical protein